MAFYSASAFEKIGANTASDEFMDTIRENSFVFMALGVVILLSMTVQAYLMESAAAEMTQNMKTLWFDALLRQDMEYFDKHDAIGEGMMITTSGQKYRSE
jgi:ABC-type multidrug transport system fused ATPase/permease subunit